MRVLVACEYSGTVRDAFLELGHEAMSCDLLPTESPGPHYQGNVLDILDHGWDLMIAHPPCQFLSYAGNSKWNEPGRADKREEAMAFFMALYNAPIPRVAIENPRGHPCKAFRKPDQEVNPFDFGTPIRKRICLWLRGLGPLFSTCVVPVEPDGFYIRKTGDRAGQPYYFYYHQSKSAKERARFFPSVAKAMAQQWAGQATEASEAA